MEADSNGGAREGRSDRAPPRGNTEWGYGMMVALPITRASTSAAQSMTVS